MHLFLYKNAYSYNDEIDAGKFRASMTLALRFTLGTHALLSFWRGVASKG
jgi:hypothetical protein